METVIKIYYQFITPKNVYKKLKKNFIIANKCVLYTQPLVNVCLVFKPTSF